MLTPPTRRRAWRLLWEFGLAHEVFRLLPLPAGTPLDPARSVFLAVDPEQPLGFGLALAAACVRREGPRPTRRPTCDPCSVKARSARPWRRRAECPPVSNDESDAMEGTLAGLAPLLGDAEPTVAVKKRFLARPTSAGSRRLMDALAAVGWHRGRIETLKRDLSALDDTDVAPPPLLTGDDLTAAGLTPGPAFKRVLDAVYDAQLEGKVTTPGEAKALALRTLE